MVDLIGSNGDMKGCRGAGCKQKEKRLGVWRVGYRLRVWQVGCRMKVCGMGGGV